MIRVAIADDHPIVREGLRRIASEGAGMCGRGRAMSPGGGPHATVASA